MNLGVKHLDERKRRSAGEAYPHPNTAIRKYDYLMYGVGLVAPLALLPQVLQVYLSHNVSGISVPTWLLLALINSLWAVYGIVHRTYPVTLTNVGMALFDVIVVIGVLLSR